MGDEMTFQANTIVSEVCTTMRGNIRTLFLPEHLSEQAYEAMKMNQLSAR